MTITVDEGLVDEVRKAFRARTRSEAIRAALAEVLRRQKLDRALAHRGKIGLGLDRSGLEKMRSEG